MNYRDALKELPNHNIIMTIGDEPFYRDQVKNRIINLNKEIEFFYLDASEQDESTIIDIIRSRDLFSTKRIFCIKNFTKIKKLENLQIEKSQDILILDSDSKGKSKVFKELEKNCLYVECIKPKTWEQEADALSKIKGYLTNSGYKIPEDVAKYLYLNIGYNLYKLMKEMQKITLYKENSSNKEICKEDIDAIVTLNLNYNIFDLSEKIIEGNKKESLHLLDMLFKYENSPAILLINVWYTHFENLLYLKQNTKSLSDNFYIKLPYGKTV
jgi:DNA polymerase III delta subunit